jgi:hypothetical protein
MAVSETWSVLEKRLLSYFKSTWDFYDYPVQSWKIPNAVKPDGPMALG